MKHRIWATFLALLVSNAYADESLCQASYLEGVAPKLLNIQVGQKTQELSGLCNLVVCQLYIVGYSDFNFTQAS